MMHHWEPLERLDSILDICIDQLDGQSLETVLRCYPQSTPQLSSMLIIAAALRCMGEVRLSDSARQRCHERLRRAVLAEQ
jgi:hypothetical protein